MSQFTGKQHRGAMRERRAVKKAEAEARSRAQFWACRIGHAMQHRSEVGAARCGL